MVMTLRRLAPVGHRVNYGLVAAAADDKGELPGTVWENY
jgi:hypothetical protein